MTKQLLRCWIVLGMLAIDAAFAAEPSPARRFRRPMSHNP